MFISDLILIGSETDNSASDNASENKEIMYETKHFSEHLYISITTLLSLFPHLIEIAVYRYDMEVKDKNLDL